MIKKTKFSISNQSGFIVADFLFAIVMVVTCGILVFALTFSLATVEISQYIVWSTARNFSAANLNEQEARSQAQKKFDALAAKFPLISGRGATGTPWFTLSPVVIGDLAKIDSDLASVLNSKGDKLNKDLSQQMRQPWIGAKSDLELKLISNLRVPFLGSVTADKKDFTFPIRAFVLRHPSQDECYSFFSKEKRYDLGIQKLDSSDAEDRKLAPNEDASKYVAIEDNGC